MSRKTLIVGAIAVLVAAGVVYFLVKKKGAPAADEGDDAGPSVVAVQTGQLKQATLHGYVDGFGTVTPAPAEDGQAPATARVASAVAGVVSKTHVVEGQRVEEGAVLFDLDDRNAKIAADRARRAAEYARNAAERQRKLYAGQNTSLKNLQDAESQAAGAEADLATAQTQLAWLRIKAPLAGVVTHLNVRPGEAVDLTTVLAEITDTDRLVVSAEIPSADAGDLKKGQTVTVQTEPPVAAAVSYISPSVDANNDTVTVHATLPKGSALRPGQFVQMRIATIDHKNVLAAPTESVVTDADGQSVVSVVTGDEAKQVKVKTGLRDGGWTEIEGPDLKAGQTVVTVGAYGLPEKTKVKLAEKEDAKTAEKPEGKASDKSEDQAPDKPEAKASDKTEAKAR